jgi:NADH-quinone oxidoreductase subunit N
VSFSADLFLPELYLLGVIAALFIQSVTASGQSARAGWVPIAGVVGVVVSLLSIGKSGTLFGAAYQVDALSQFFKAAVALGFTIATLNARVQPTLEGKRYADYFMFLALSCFGLMVLSSAVELVTIYLALEISSYPLYAVIPLRSSDRRAAEAGIKYILFGAAATAVALFGLSFIIAQHNTTYLDAMSGLGWSFSDAPLAVIGLGLFLCGFLYKLALFPFHFWCPDLYEGASNETAAFAATLPKLGAVVILVRLASLLKPDFEITAILALLGAVSMTYGNLAALIQKDVKRMLGYSSVSHAGYLMLGLVSGTPKGLAAAAFYSLVYLLMNLTCFWVVSSMSVDGRNIELDDLRGLHRRSPMLAFTMAVAAFSLVGLPPTAGFIGKLFLLTSAWGYGYNWLVVVACVNTAIAIFYYLNLVRYAYTSDASPSGLPELPAVFRAGSTVWAAVLSAAILALGVYPNPIFQWTLTAGARLLQ